MKIIGKTAAGFIIEAREDEAYNLIGYYSRYSEKKHTLEIGAEIRIHEMYQYLNTLGDGQVKIRAAAESLRKLAEQIEIVAPLVPAKEAEVAHV